MAIIMDLDIIPHLPGVYLMKNLQDEIIYVGKAKDLRKRVASYFSRALKDIKTEFLVQKIDHINYIVTQNEQEALILENQLIKKYLPHYNILLKDHKSYLRISIDYNEEFPIIQTTREKSRKRVRYFGPFPSSHNAKALVQIAERFFGLRRCRKKISSLSSSHSSPCFLYDLKSCPGACVGKDSSEAYKSRLKRYISFLAGHFTKTKREIEKLMGEASAQTNFEEAARLRDFLSSIQEIQEQQKIYFESQEIVDVWGFFEDSGKYTFTLLRFDCGILSQNRSWHTQSSLPLQEIFDSIINEIYLLSTIAEQKREGEISLLESQILQLEISSKENSAKTPQKILLPFDSPLSSTWEESLTSLFGHKVQLLQPFPPVWDKLAEMSNTNARNYWKSFYKVTQSESALVELKELLNLPKIPLRIETFDISNIGDSFCVGSCVVFVDGMPHKKDYRHYKIKYTKGQNDYAMMQEVLLRRFKSTDTFPDLLVIDGGKGHVHAAGEILSDMKLSLPFIGLAKKEELMILPSSKSPIKLPHTHPALRLLVAGRDEAHRFANKLRAQLLHKKTFESCWDQVYKPGSKMNLLLRKNFSSYEELLGSSLEDLEKKTDLSIRSIQSILDKVRNLSL